LVHGQPGINFTLFRNPVLAPSRAKEGTIEGVLTKLKLILNCNRLVLYLDHYVLHNSLTVKQPDNAVAVAGIMFRVGNHYNGSSLFV
jgi:hypothetical protein